MSIDLVIRGGNMPQASADAQVLKTLRMAMSDNAPIPATIGSRVFATESISESDNAAISQAASNLQATLSSVVSQLGLDAQDSANRSLRFVQENAGVQAALLASAADSFVNRQVAFPKTGNANLHVVHSDGVPNYLGRRSTIFAAEAFDNREGRSAVLYSAAYNYVASRQDAFGETIWPTLTLPADQVGFGVVVNRLTIHRGVTHTVDGKVVDFGKVDLMRAEANHEILRKDKNRIFPIVRPASEQYFVPAAVIAPVDYDNEGVVIKTAPLKTGVDVGILGISQTDASLEGGMNNQTDALDPAISLENLYVEVGDDVLKFNVYSHHSANFTFATQGVDQLRHLNFSSKSLSITADTVNVDGTPLATLAAVKTNKLSVILEVRANGEANVEFGSVSVFGNRVGVVAVLDEDGNKLASTDADVQDITAAFASAKIFGYDVRAYRTNVNMRERGDFIDRTNFTQLYEVPLLSPITAQRPQNTDGQLDSSDFEALVTSTRFRLKNDAVTAILDATTRLYDYVKAGVTAEEPPRSLGAARFHVIPTFFAPAEINVATSIDSWSTSNRIKDLQAFLVNTIRDYAFRMYVQSEYQAAASALGMSERPTLIIATDPIIERYIMVDGELRTLTDKFDFKIVSTLDRRMAGKVFCTFGVFDGNRNQAPNILNWGNLVWAPEVVMHASVPRGESMSRETIVQPRYLFVNHLPVATMLQFKGIPETLNRIPVQFKNVP